MWLNHSLVEIAYSFFMSSWTSSRVHSAPAPDRVLAPRPFSLLWLWDFSPSGWMLLCLLLLLWISFCFAGACIQGVKIVCLVCLKISLFYPYLFESLGIERKIGNNFYLKLWRLYLLTSTIPVTLEGSDPIWSKLWCSFVCDFLPPLLSGKFGMFFMFFVLWNFMTRCLSVNSTPSFMHLKNCVPFPLGDSYFLIFWEALSKSPTSLPSCGTIWEIRNMICDKLDKSSSFIILGLEDVAVHWLGFLKFPNLCWKL